MCILAKIYVFILINIGFSQRSVILTLQTFTLQAQNEFLELLQVSVFQLLRLFL